MADIMNEEEEDHDFEPPSLSASSAVPPPPSAAFSSGGPPPAGVFSSHSAGTGDNATTATVTPSNDDLNSRWKNIQEEQEQQTRNKNVVSPEKKDGSSSYNNYNLYETPEKLKQSASTTTASTSTSAASNRHNLSASSRQLYSSGNHSDLLAEPVEPRRTYSFTKSSSYDTNSLIQKYAGVSGMPQMAPPPPPPPPPSSNERRRSSQSQSQSQSFHSNNEPSATSVREEAMKVLAMADQSPASNTANANVGTHDVNQPFNVRRTESGGFRASMGLGDIMPGAGNTMQPYYGGTKRTNSFTSSKIRTPSALAGLGLSSTSSSNSSTSNNNERVDWKSGRYSFSDPQFREDDYLDNEEEDDIVDGPAVPDDHRKIMSSSYRDHPSQSQSLHRKEVFDTINNGDFEGDFPRGNNNSSGNGRVGQGSGNSGSSSWSSRYSDNPRMNNSNLLDRWDTGNQQQPSEKRQSARNMFMSTASNVRAAAGNVSKSVSNGISSASASAKATETEGGGTRVFGAGFSFRKSNTFGNNNQNTTSAHERDEATNLRTVWKDSKDDAFEDECSIASHAKGGAKTWEQVMYEKKRRRRIGISILCVLLALIIIGVSVGQTSFKWKNNKSFNKRNNGNGMAVTFYATSNTPSSNGSGGGGGSGGVIGNQKQLSLDLQNIPNDAEFITHLGNLQDSSITQCSSNRYDEIKSIFKQSSPVPIFLVPGEHDWMNCPNPSYSWAKWLGTFSKFTENTFGESNGMVITRPKTSPELFATVHHGVLFIGLHLVNGSLNSVFGGDQGQKEMDIRNEQMVIFVRGTLDNLRGQFRAVVLMGNARPSQQQQPFFDGISTALKDSKSPVIYLHADSNKVGYVQHHPFSGGDDDYLKKLLAVQVPNGGIGQSPLRIAVGFGKRPFQIG
jgi:hypothetical protein